MKIRLLAGGFVLGAAMALLAAQAVSQDSQARQAPAAPAPPSEEEMARIMEQWQKMATPGEHHRLLDRFVGQWKTRTMVMSMGPEPMVSEGAAQTMVVEVQYERVGE